MISQNQIDKVNERLRIWVIWIGRLFNFRV